MNWLDILLGVFIFVNAVRGFSQGLVLMGFKMAGAVVALYVAIFYRDTVVSFIKGAGAVEYAIAEIFKLPQDPQLGSDVIKVLGLSTVVDMALGAIGFLLVFLLVNLAFLVPAYFIDGLMRLTAIKPINRALGLILGVARTVFVIALVSSALSPFMMAWPGGWLEKGFNTSYILYHLKYFDIFTPIVVELI